MICMFNLFFKSYNFFRHSTSYVTRTLYSGDKLRSDLTHTEVGKMFKSPVFNMVEASKREVQQFLDSFDTVLVDCDGVLWIGDYVIPQSPDVMDYFRKIGKRVYFVTNNSTKTRAQFALKAQRLGFTASPNEILSSAFLLAQYLKGIGFMQKVYVIGSEALGEELTAVNIKHIGIGPDPVTPDFRTNLELDPSVRAVVVGFDEHISYPKLMKAATYLQHNECLFVATNSDERFPKTSQIIEPGTGALLKAVETGAKYTAKVIGKPNEYIRNYLRRYDLDPARTLMIGDRINTDIEFGVRCGYRTLLVLSGVTYESDVVKIRAERTQPLPDLVIPSLGTLLNMVPKI